MLSLSPSIYVYNFFRCHKSIFYCLVYLDQVLYKIDYLTGTDEVDSFI